MSKYFSDDRIFLQQSEKTNAMKGKRLYSTTGTKGMENIGGMDFSSEVKTPEFQDMPPGTIVLQVDDHYLTQLAVDKAELGQDGWFQLDISDDE